MGNKGPMERGMDLPTASYQSQSDLSFLPPFWPFPTFPFLFSFLTVSGLPLVPIFSLIYLYYIVIQISVVELRVPKQMF